MKKRITAHEVQYIPYPCEDEVKTLITAHEDEYYHIDKEKNLQYT